MTVSSLPCWRKRPEAARLVLPVWAVLAALLWACMAPPAAAANPEIRYAELVPADESYVMNADIGLELNPRLVEVVERGLALYFVAECVVTRPRWYWWDETVVEKRLAFRLTYQALTRKYRLSLGSIGQTFDSLEDAVLALRRIRNWDIVERDRLRGGTSYNVAMRFRFDTAQLPKPLQVTAIGSRDWNLETPWSSWTFLASAPAR